MAYSREEKLAHAKHLLYSSEWLWYKSELAKLVKLKEFNINYQVDKNMEFNAGLVAGIKWCLELPAKTEKDCDTFLNRAARLAGLAEDKDLTD